jgi:putative transposase
MITAHRHSTLANPGKVEALAALFPAFREALGGLQSLTRREVLNGESLSRWRIMPKDALPFTHSLSARQMKSVQNMTHAAVSGWQESLVGRVRDLITGSTLPQHRKVVLYRINARKAWWSKELSLPWTLDGATGELIPSSDKQAEADPAVVWLSVDAADLAMARRLAKQGQKRHRYPDLRRVNTLALDSIVAKVSQAETATHDGTVGWWVKIATLSKGKPVQVPLAGNPYFDQNMRAAMEDGGGLCGAVQLHLTRDCRGQPSGVEISLLLDTPDAELRADGQWLGLDFGFSAALFATNEGQLLGQAMLKRLRELDAVLTTHTADLHKRGIKLKSNPFYRALQKRITGYVTNEIGRLLNQIATRHGEHAVKGLVVEKLDFRSGGLSRRMNRLATRTGRQLLQARLKALTSKHGIAIIEVPSPWTSCECSGCGYTAKANRKGSLFRCRFCGLTLHADVNAARVVLSRRSRQTPDHTGPRSRKHTLQLLDSQHRKRWRLPVEGAVPGIAGALGQSAWADCEAISVNSQEIANCEEMH